jgi:hypothetical protein
VWHAIIGFLGGPVIKGLLDAYNAHLKAATADAKIAADLAGKEIAAQTIETQQQTQYRIAELGHWWEPDKLMGYFVALYLGKLIVWDKVLGLGVTDGLCKVGDSCWTGSVANLIVAFYFGKRGLENVATIIGRAIRK